jgi:hypothetical protein
MGNLMGTSPKKPVNISPVSRDEREKDGHHHGVKPVEKEPEIIEPVLQLSVAERSLQQLEEISNKVNEIMEIVNVIKNSMPIPTDQKEKSKLSVMRAEEDVMQQLLKCDNVECDETTRKNRKELVLTIQKNLTLLDNLKNEVIKKED